MADIFSREARSKIMSAIRSKDTKPEILLRKKLFNQGYRYSLKYRFKELNFRPDIVLVSRKTCVFVDGCFWHKCPKCYKPPRSNRSYWVPKLDRNVERDSEQNRFLRKNGWKAIRIWEHELWKDADKSVKKIEKIIRK